jgi:hypothetical protein
MVDPTTEKKIRKIDTIVHFLSSSIVTNFLLNPNWKFDTERLKFQLCNLQINIVFSSFEFYSVIVH